jgi:hypothetical protein
LIGLQSFGQQGKPFISNYPPLSYSSNDYVSGPQNWCVEKDVSGKIFVANQIGIMVYDGVGRWATLAQSNSNHESHGLNIAFERIDLFNKSNGFEGEHRTTDLLDDNQNPAGTRVEFTVPVLKSTKY